MQAITTADYPLPAPRPVNSRLDCSKLQTTFDLFLPPWQTQVQRLIDELPL
ncbi:sugar nucleotide-binding protein [Thiomonas sp. 13-64-67]|uniref:sugar nucleotide-binding protein n=1 Tax=Thiomonas sp. 13-64-67 TaxID=1970447 RepID=UPI00257DB723|nr:sugar nucleotide-binding protein [Thiomonas sp. 13-64-67]